MSDPSDIASQKETLRTSMRQAVSGMSREARRSASRAIAKALAADPVWARARVVMAFLADPGEPNLDPLLESAMASGIEISAPRMDWQTRSMTARRLDAIDLIETRRHGIREPVGEASVVAAESLDVVLVPGVAFDGSGNRLGRGGGFYDRFISAVPHSAHIVGVCFEIQRVGRVPCEPHDAGVRMLVTEAGMIPAD